MSNGTNILILSAGTRDKVVQYFKRSLAGRGRVLATDMSEYAPAIYEADEHFIVPSMTDEGYLDVILGICRDNDVKGALSHRPRALSAREERRSFRGRGDHGHRILLRPL